MKHWSGPGTLSGDSVHLACMDVSQPSYPADRLMETLSEKEREKAGKFRFRTDRDRFIASRGFLRILLGHYLEEEPGTLKFRDGPYGKPSLDPEFHRDSITFSVSHSDRLVLYAIARNRRIGVDIERIRRDFPHEPISERYFSPREAALIEPLPPGVRREAFFSYWVLKEAFVKATGCGLSLPMNRFEVAIDPPRLVSMNGNSEAASGWQLQRIHPGAGYAAGLAAEGSDLRIGYWSHRGTSVPGE